MDKKILKKREKKKKLRTVFLKKIIIKKIQPAFDLVNTKEQHNLDLVNIKMKKQNLNYKLK